MRKRAIFLFVLCVLIALPPATVPAQAQEPGSQLFHVTDVQVKPAMAQKYEAAVKKEIELGYPGVFYGSRTDDYHYYTVVPISRYAGIDTLLSREETWMANAGKEKIDELMKSAEGTFDSYETYVMSQEPSLSYYPSHPRAKYSDIKVVCWAFAYVEWGKEKELEKVFKEWVALYKSKDLGNGWETYVVRLGPSLPLYIWETGGKSAADFFAADEEDTKVLGKEVVNALWNKTMACLRKYDFKMGSLRPDLSNFPRKK